MCPKKSAIFVSKIRRVGGQRPFETSEYSSVLERDQLAAHQQWLERWSASRPQCRPLSNLPPPPSACCCSPASIIHNFPVFSHNFFSNCMTARVTRHKFKSNLLQLLRLIWNYLERVSAAHRASSRFWESCLSTCTCTRGSMSFVMMKMQKLKKTTAMRFTIIALPSSCFSLSMWDLWICISTEDFTVLQYYIMCEQLTSVLNVIIWKEDWRQQTKLDRSLLHSRALVWIPLLQATLQLNKHTSMKKFLKSMFDKV